MKAIDLTADGSITKKIIVEGSGALPEVGQICKIKYTGTLTDGTQFDQNLQIEKPFKFLLGKGQVIKGLDIGIATMKQNEQAIFQISSEYGYGEEGLPPKIPGGEVLIFDVELLLIKVPKRKKWDMNLTEREAEAIKLKEEGNEAFKKNNLLDALTKYKASWELASYGTETTKDTNLSINIQLNIAQTQLNLRDYTQAIAYSTQVVTNLDCTKQQMVKALYRRGMAHVGLGLHEQAKYDFEIGVQIDPTNVDFKNELHGITQKMAQVKQKQKAVYAKLFQSPLYDEDADTKSEYSDASNPWVYLDIQIESEAVQRIEIELFANFVPKTVENFIGLCTGEKLYKQSHFHRLMKNFMIQGGDYEQGNGKGGQSVWGGKFEDENFRLKHQKRGYVAMANSGPNSNASQFFITFKNTPWLDGKHVVFGVVRSNFALLSALEAEEVGAKDVPDRRIVIVDCGRKQ